MSKKRVTRFSAKDRRELLAKLQAYLESCRPPPESDAKKNAGRLPNLAGFCRFLGRTLADLEELAHTSPVLYGRISAILEDELLNFSPSPTLLSLYLKKRLGYLEENDAGERETACGQVRLIFEHDIEEDGA